VLPRNHHDADPPDRARPNTARIPYTAAQRRLLSQLLCPTIASTGQGGRHLIAADAAQFIRSAGHERRTLDAICGIKPVRSHRPKSPGEKFDGWPAPPGGHWLISASPRTIASAHKEGSPHSRSALHCGRVAGRASISSALNRTFMPGSAPASGARQKNPRLLHRKPQAPCPRDTPNFILRAAKVRNHHGHAANDAADCRRTLMPAKTWRVPKRA